MWHVGSNINVHLWRSTVEIILNISMLVLTKTRKSKDLGIIYLVRAQNFLENQHCLPSDRNTQMCVSGGKKC